MLILLVAKNYPHVLFVESLEIENQCKFDNASVKFHEIIDNIRDQIHHLFVALNLQLKKGKTPIEAVQFFGLSFLPYDISYQSIFLEKSTNSVGKNKC